MMACLCAWLKIAQTYAIIIKEGGVKLFVSFIIFTIFFIISMLMALLILFGACCKNIGTDADMGAFLFTVLCACSIYALGLLILYTAPHVWGLAYIFFVMGFGAMLPFFIAVPGAAIFTKKSIYKVKNYVILKRYSYDDIIGYVMKKEATVVRTKFGPKTVHTYDTEIYLNDYAYISFGVSREKSRKIRHIKKLLQDHGCHRNGRIPQKYRSPYID